MDQNYEFQQNYQQTPPARKDAEYFRACARKALKNFYWYAVLVALLVGFLGAGAESTSFSFNINIGDSNQVETVFNNAMEAYERGGFIEVLNTFTGLWIAVIVGAVSAVFGFAFRLLVGSPVKLGYERYKLDLIDGDGKNVKSLFNYFKQGYGKSIVLRLLRGLIDLAISLPAIIVTGIYVAYTFGMLANRDASAIAASEWTTFGLLLVATCLIAFATAVVQIIVTYRYWFCYTIMAEYPEISPVDALRNSANLMKGKKWKLFCLNFSFIGWILLAGFCTCGIGTLFLTPYIDTAVIAFYDDITNRSAAKDVVFPSLNPDDYDPNAQNL